MSTKLKPFSSSGFSIPYIIYQIFNAWSQSVKHPKLLWFCYPRMANQKSSVLIKLFYSIFTFKAYILRFTIDYLPFCKYNIYMQKNKKTNIWKNRPWNMLLINASTIYNEEVNHNCWWNVWKFEIPWPRPNTLENPVKV